MLEEELIECLYFGKYYKARDLVKKITPEALYNLLLKISFDNGTISVYGFLVFLLSHDESAYLHYSTSVIMSTGLVHFEGAYSIGLWHARRSIELEPNNIEYKEWVLSFYGIPDKIMSDEEAFSIAQEILRNDFTNEIALKAFEDIKWFQAKS